MKMKKENVQNTSGVVLSALVFFGGVILSPSADAVSVYIDDFEDGDLSGWLETALGSGSGSTSVVNHNGSLMANVQHTGFGSHSLSQDFSYVANGTLSFTMQAIATANRAHASSGITVSFLNTFNVALGSVSIVNTTDPASVGPNTLLVDAAQHDYSAEIIDWVSQSGLDDTDPISKISLSYWATASVFFVTNRPPLQSSAEVWFDNVHIEAPPVPIPAAVWLFGSGLLGLIGAARRKKT